MSRIFRFAFALFMLLSVVASSRADEIDTYTAEQLKRQNVPGLSLAV